MYDSAGAVPSLEVSLHGDDTLMPHCEALLYETSPSNGYPASYSVLRADDEDIKQAPGFFEETNLGATRYIYCPDDLSLILRRSCLFRRDKNAHTNCRQPTYVLHWVG